MNFIRPATNLLRLRFIKLRFVEGGSRADFFFKGMHVKELTEFEKNRKSSSFNFSTKLSVCVRIN